MITNAYMVFYEELMSRNNSININKLLFKKKKNLYKTENKSYTKPQQQK